MSRVTTWVDEHRIIPTNDLSEDKWRELHKNYSSEEDGTLFFYLFRVYNGKVCWSPRTTRDLYGHEKLPDFPPEETGWLLCILGQYRCGDYFWDPAIGGEDYEAFVRELDRLEYQTERTKDRAESTRNYLDFVARSWRHRHGDGVLLEP